MSSEYTRQDVSRYKILGLRDREMGMFAEQSARSLVCVSALTVLQATLVIRTSSHSFLLLSSCSPVTLLTVEAASLAVCSFPAVSQTWTSGFQYHSLDQSAWVCALAATSVSQISREKGRNIK